MAPDSGAFPGGTPLLCSLTHYVATGTLVRRLFARAADERQRGYAAGWLTHLVADVRLHPMVNRGAAALLGRPLGSAVAYEEDPQTHMRVELGLEAGLMPSLQIEWSTLPVSGFSSEDRRFIADAVQDTYGVPITAATLENDERACRIYAGKLLQLARITSARFTRSIPPAPSLRAFLTDYPLVRANAALFGPRGRWYGVATAVRPPAWLEEEARRTLERLPIEICDLLENDLASLSEYNLDTGEMLPTPGYRAAVEALRRLEEVRDSRKGLGG